MLTRIAATIAVFGFISYCGATEIGIGLSMKQGENGIFVPFKINNNILIEGFIRHNTNNDNSSSTQLQSFDISYSSYEIGVGFFWKKSINEKLYLYSGPRISYKNIKHISIYNEFSSSPGFRLEDKANGFTMAPMLGMEFFPIKYFSIGGEIGYEYSRLHGTASQSSAGSISREGISRGTVSSIILRLYF